MEGQSNMENPDEVPGLSNERVKELLARPYQLELLEKAKRNNIIVYLGTGSGKTFIAIMLIKHMRGEFGQMKGGRVRGGKKAIFLVSSVALVDQQCREIRNCTGLEVGSYCGADGVDDWTIDKWREEFSKHQVLVFVHEVFRALLSHKYMRFPDIALIILDECHHAVKNHPYAMIMQYYQDSKEAGEEVPKVLGLTACVVVETCDVHKFRQKKLTLETKMDAKVQTTEDLLDILRYVTAPKESFVYFDSTFNNEGIKMIMESFDAALEELSRVREEEALQLKTMKSIHQHALAKKDLDKDFKRLKNEVLTTWQGLVDSIGIYSLMSKANDLLKEIRSERIKENNMYYNQNVRNEMFKITEKCLGDTCKMLQKLLQQSRDLSKLDRIHRFTNEKFKMLLDIIRKERSQDDQDPFKNMSAIVFVERKSTAVNLCSALSDIVDQDPDFHGLRIDYVHSVDTGFDIKNFRPTGQGIAERRRLQEVLSLFRSQHLHLIVSTSVVEEGLDVRSCNLVIKYDFPMTFRSYIQSKGRARKRPSKYIMMSSNKMSGTYNQKHSSFKTVEQISLAECHTIPDAQPDLEEEDELETFTADPSNPEVSGTVTGSQAISLVYQYIDKIPVDRFTRLIPVWVKQQVDGSAQDQLLRGLGLSSDSGIKYLCYMPHKTPFCLPVEGPVRPNKKAAKQACALEVVRQLYDLGELTQRLKVKKRVIEMEDSDDEDDYDERGRKVGTRRKRNFFHHCLPSPLSAEPRNVAFLYQVRMQLENLIEDARYAPYFPQEDSVSLGFLLADPMPDIEQLRLYGPSGSLLVSVSYSKKVDISPALMKRIKDFHLYAFTEVLKIGQVEHKEPSFLLVPLENGDINLDLCRDRKDETISCDSVVYPKYKPGENYFIEEFVPSFNPTCVMFQTKQTYIDYYRDKHNIQIKDPSQPLLRISSADKKLYMYKPGGEAMKDKNSEDLSKRTLLVPELMNVAKIQRGLWKQIQVIPFCIERTSSLLHSTQLSEQLTGILNPISHKISLEESWCSNITQKDRKHIEWLLKFDPGVPLVNVPLLEALTLRSCDDVVNMERLEVLGDVFLKYRASMLLYNTALADETQNKTNANEGELTTLRSKIVGNKNLRGLAVDLNLHEGPVNAVKIETHTTYLPPGFTAPIEERLKRLDGEFHGLIEDPGKRKTLSVGSLLQYVDPSDLRLPDHSLLDRAKERFLSKRVMPTIPTRQYRLIADKSLADVMEALIGSYLLNTGQKNTLQVMAAMGLDLTGKVANLSSVKRDVLDRAKHSTQVSDVREFIPEEDAFANQRMKFEDNHQIFERLGVNEIERKIGYTFKEKSFLLQAFTHSSYGENMLTDSYERLEYLGDAVLDYLVTCYIFLNSDADPGTLTDVRSALVCNNMFAALLVDSGLHGNILYSAPQVRKKISDYVEYRNNERIDITRINRQRNTLRIVDSLKLINEVEPPELSEVEVPKVLGDVFEALIGAVFIDSGYNVETVYKVYLRFNPKLNEILTNPPKNPKKMLHECCNEVKFGKAVVRENHVSVKVTVPLDGKDYSFIGRGNNRRMAELAASKCALRRLFSHL